MIEKLSEIHPLLPPIAGALALLIAAIVVDLLVRNIVVKTIQAVAKRSRATWDDTLIKHKVISRLVQVVPGLIVFSGVPFVPGLPDAVVQLTRNVATGYMVLMLTMALTALLSASNAIYSRLPFAKTRSL